MIHPDEASPEDFAASIGRAIISWQHVERECAVLFCRLMRAGNGMGAIAAFYHITNFSTRAELLEISARFYMAGVHPHPEAAAFSQLQSRLILANSMRNRIVHSEVNEEMTETGWIFTLAPHMFDWSKMPIGDGERLKKWAQKRSERIISLSIVKAAEAEFDAIATEVNRLWQSIADEQTDGVSSPPEF